jgi:hypothetical protein
MLKSKKHSQFGLITVLSVTLLFSCDKKYQEVVPQKNEADSMQSLRLDMKAARTDQSQLQAASAQNPLHTRIQEMWWGGDLRTHTETGTTWRGGYAFTANTSGGIMALAVRMPAPGRYFATLWDAATKKMMGRTIIDQAAGGAITYGVMTSAGGIPVYPFYASIQANKRYVVTMDVYSGQGYHSFQIAQAFPDRNFMPVPAASGKVTIEYGCWKYLSVTWPNRDSASYPGDSNISQSVLYGYPDINIVLN